MSILSIRALFTLRICSHDFCVVLFNELSVSLANDCIILLGQFPPSLKVFYYFVWLSEPRNSEFRFFCLNLDLQRDLYVFFAGIAYQVPIQRMQGVEELFIELYTFPSISPIFLFEIRIASHQSVIVVAVYYSVEHHVDIDNNTCACKDGEWPPELLKTGDHFPFHNCCGQRLHCSLSSSDVLVLPRILAWPNFLLFLEEVAV